MTFAIPAAPGTYLTNDDDERITVVGWLVHPGGIASPVTIHRVDDLAVYTVIHPGGTAEGLLGFESAPPEPKSPSSVRAAPKGQKAAPAASGGPVSLTGKEYAKKTFWRVEIGETDVVVLIEGGNPVPKGEGVTKITRDDYFRLRKEVREVTYSELDDVFAGESSEPDADDDDDDLI